ncbi:glyoxalase [Streptomyces ossamyceticus]|uniref:glyoxalase n=1 Tax=Streptomyces ossamyceticus TaxID=249581 RepID=UPI00341746EC
MGNETLGYALSGLHHVQLAIPPGAEDRCRELWVGVPGMTELEKPPALTARGGCWFRSGSLEIHLGVEEDFHPNSKAHPGILVTSIHALAKRLEDNGVGITWDDNFPGYARFYAFDDLGNRLEFLEPSRKTERG